MLEYTLERDLGKALKTLPLENCIMVDIRLLLFFFSFKVLKEVKQAVGSRSCEVYVYEVTSVLDAFLKLKCIKVSEMF